MRWRVSCKRRRQEGWPCGPGEQRLAVLASAAHLLRSQVTSVPNSRLTPYQWRICLNLIRKNGSAYRRKLRWRWRLWPSVLRSSSTT